MANVVTLIENLTRQVRNYNAPPTGTMTFAGLPPGVYTLTVKVDDNVSKQQIAPSVRFAVE